MELERKAKEFFSGLVLLTLVAREDSVVEGITPEQI